MVVKAYLGQKILIRIPTELKQESSLKHFKGDLR